jgi:hypothetical protein
MLIFQVIFFVKHYEVYIWTKLEREGVVPKTQPLDFWATPSGQVQYVCGFQKALSL